MSFVGTGGRMISIGTVTLTSSPAAVLASAVRCSRPNEASSGIARETVAGSLVSGLKPNGPVPASRTAGNCWPAGDADGDAEARPRTHDGAADRHW